jgi:hypothetical protein
MAHSEECKRWVRIFLEIDNIGSHPDLDAYQDALKDILSSYPNLVYPKMKHRPDMEGTKVTHLEYKEALFAIMSLYEGHHLEDKIKMICVSLMCSHYSEKNIVILDGSSLVNRRNFFEMLLTES